MFHSTKTFITSMLILPLMVMSCNTDEPDTPVSGDTETNDPSQTQTPENDSANLSITINADGTNSFGVPFRRISETKFSLNYIIYEIVSGHLNVTGADDTEIEHSLNGEVKLFANITIDNYTYKVRKIESKAMYGCKGLKALTIPATITDIGRNAFCYCSNLNTVYYYAAECQVERGGSPSPDDVVFHKNLRNVIIGDKVKFIPRNIFNECEGLTSIAMPTSVSYIGSYAFYNCTNLQTVNIYNSETTIEQSTVPDCSNVTSVNISNSETGIGRYAFARCSSLATITIPSSITGIGSYAFAWCSSLATITILSSITGIGSYAFAWCSSLATITIPSSITEIGESAFSGCSSLTSVNIPNFVPYIAPYTFWGCESLTSVIIPNSVTKIGRNAFECRNLTSVICLNPEPPEIGYETFKYIPRNCNLYIPRGWLFEYCYSDWTNFFIIENIIEIDPEDYIFD